jgi:hypothetical protein
MSGSEEAPYEEVDVRLSEIIIKVEGDIIVMPEGVYKAPVENIDIRSKELKELNSKFNLVTIEKMYARKKSEEEVAREFPEREMRAPEGVKNTDIDNTYLLRFPEHIDAREIAREYQEIEGVIYAEENKVMKIF